ncbi:hypothetical protein LBMAG27_25440 [Bacteroidota bacterium]|nr:hypothetical protein LBMAG27_25440 [Bacteroidota bacterium]
MKTQLAFEYKQTEANRLLHLSDQELIDRINQVVRNPFYGYAHDHCKIILEAEIKKRKFNSDTLFYWSKNSGGDIIKKFDLDHRVKLVNGFLVRMDQIKFERRKNFCNR